MARRPWAFLCVAAAGVLALGACSRHGGDGNLSALGSTGTGNGVAVSGASGKGTADSAGATQPAAPGVGLNGGLGTGVANSTPATGSTTSAPSGTGPDSATLGGSGSTNMTTHSSVGNR